jgi:23S rRNA (cytosine1962-C5)-methyltransferase
MRKLRYTPADSYRLLFAESDLVPGLIVERYAAIDGKVYLVVQFLTLGVDRFRDDIVAALREVVSPDGIYERSDVHVRGLEGIPERSGWIGAESDPVIVIRENGVELEVDLAKGQKTGYFLDQKDNRRLVASIASGRRVLDTFTHTGAFGLNACAGGAASVVSVDISEEAVATVNANIARNGAGDRMTAVAADVFDLLKQYEREGKTFDLIILDPPAFTKSAKMIEKAYGGYKEINLRAMKLLVSGGYLVTCSCSHFFTADHFYRMIQNAAMDAHRTAQILEKRGPGPDHPALVGYPESDYLKCALLRVW